MIFFLSFVEISDEKKVNHRSCIAAQSLSPVVPRSQQAKRKREIYQLRRTTFRRLKSTNRDPRRPPVPIFRRYLIRTRSIVESTLRFASNGSQGLFQHSFFFASKHFEIIFTYV